MPYDFDCIAALPTLPNYMPILKKKKVCEIRTGMVGSAPLKGLGHAVLGNFVSFC